MKEFRKTKEGLFICEECNHFFVKKENLSRHINLKHDRIQKYYDKWIKEEYDGKCKICNNETEFMDLNGYKDCCCKKHIHSYAGQIRKEKMLINYGVTCNSKRNEVQEKMKKTCLERYGVETPFKSKEVQEKIKKKWLKNYGVDHPFKSKEVQEKIKKTCLEKYGVEHTLQVKEIREKGKQTKLEKYGHEYYNNPIKRKENCLKKYGVKYLFQSKEIREKSKQTKLKKYGDENFVNNKKAKQTCLEKYGNENYNNSKKNKQTCLKRYGVEYPLQNEKIYNKAFKTRIQLHNYLNTNLTYQGSYEKDFLDKFYDKIDIENGPSIKYLFEEKNKVYHSDFYIPSKNLIVEIKSSYILTLDKEIKEKKVACINQGYDYILILNKDYSNFKL